ncbi:hypothetical protein BMS3Abin04_01335 [bacterium BMS3Abin04]|nr:hypothetical protein BMS3Abin04_01335 [bacterium BMS3Abin04]
MKKYDLHEFYKGIFKSYTTKSHKVAQRKYIFFKLGKVEEGKMLK